MFVSLQVRLSAIDGAIHRMRQQPEATQRDYEAALVVANAAGLHRQAMQLQTNLSDAYLRQGRPKAALAAMPRTPLRRLGIGFVLFATGLESSHLLAGAAFRPLLDNWVADLGGLAAAGAPVVIERFRRRFIPNARHQQRQRLRFQ